jgi:DNA-binding PucR family transcriptional regulator
LRRIEEIAGLDLRNVEVLVAVTLHLAAAGIPAAT